MTRLVFVSIALAGLALIINACGNDDKGGSATATATPTQRPTPTRSPPMGPTNVPLTVPTQPTPNGTPTDSPTELSAALEMNRTKWNAAGIANYQFDVKIRCFCGQDGLPLTTMIVRDGQSVSMTNSDGPIVPMGPWYDIFIHYYTAELLFQEIDTDIRESRGVHVVTYDGEYGFPTEIDVSGNAPDAGSNVNIYGFEILQ